jgi:drug/metabolite transporter (DMT)-like permease
LGIFAASREVLQAKINAMNLQPYKYATILALGTALISGTANFLAKVAVTAVKDPIVFTTMKNVIVAVFLIGLMFLAKKWPEIAALNKSQLFKLIAIGVIGGSVPFALFFTGLSQTSALNAGLIHKTLFLWVAILAIPLLKERMTRLQWLGIASIFAANLVIGGFSGFKYNIGELMIFAATIFWAVENIIAKVALRNISSLTVAGARMTLGSLILAVLVVSRGGGGAILNLGAEQWGWTILTSILLLGYVLTWYTALKYAPATYVATLLVSATLVTNILSALFVTRTFSVQQLFSAILFVAGASLVIIFAKKTAENIGLEKTAVIHMP